ncbi:MAG: protease modulator HflK N-terminal domain-containing protein, partial [Proteobacteria bacterium]|nr:protease modulator HflK N-terminal domain-containing protein [Pseudomonadota bacterium]
MAWNEPGDNNKDPWNKQGPPDLDEVVQKIQNKLGGIFGGGGSNGDSGYSGPPIWIVLILAVSVWGLFGIYTVRP